MTPYGNTYNLGWEDHLNFRWGGQGENDNRNHNQQSSSSSGMSLKDIVKSLVDNSLKFQ